MSGFAKLLPCGHLDWENCRCAEPDSLKKEPATDGVEVKGQNELPYYVQWEYGDGATRVQHTDDLATLFSDLRWALETARIDRVAISRNRNLHAAIPASAGSGSNASSLPETEKALEEKEPSTEAAHVLQNALGLMFDPDDPIGSFERTGELYYQDTGFLRPGKSEPMETGRDANDAENKDRFIKWLDGKRREVIADIKRILSSPATKSEGGSEFPQTEIRAALEDLRNGYTEKAEQLLSGLSSIRRPSSSDQAIQREEDSSGKRGAP